MSPYSHVCFFCTECQRLSALPQPQLGNEEKKNRSNKKVAWSATVEVCLGGVQFIRNIPSITAASGVHLSRRKSSTTGRCGPEKRFFSLSVHIAFTPLFGYPFASAIALGFTAYCSNAGLQDCPVRLHHASHWRRHLVICLCSFCC